jgi:hypothetical protein
MTIGGGGAQGSAQPTTTTTTEVPNPVMSPDGGTFTAPLIVTITNMPSGCTAYFTTDGSNPEIGSTRG